MRHYPKDGDILGSSAECGATALGEPNQTLTMHVFDYDCPECKRLTGEKG